MTIALATNNHIITGYVLVINQDYTNIQNDPKTNLKLYSIPDNINTNMIRVGYTTLEDIDAKLL